MNFLEKLKLKLLYLKFLCFPLCANFGNTVSNEFYYIFRLKNLTFC